MRAIAAENTGRDTSLELCYTERDFLALRDILRERTGIALGDSKRCMVYARLARRLRSQGLSSFASYVRRLREGDEAEVRAFVSALSTHVTSFFREAHHFETLTRQVLPGLLEARNATRRLRLWSAGCSSGQEAYSIAASLLDALPDGARWDVKILATDLVGEMVERGRRGVYPASDLETCVPVDLRRWFQRGTGPNEHLVRVAPELRSLVRFRNLNLLDVWPMAGLFDVIFCRNVLIYFDRKTQHAMYRRFADALACDGYLFLGHSESLAQLSSCFTYAGRTVYRKAA